MVTKIAGGMRGVDHVAYPTWKLEETVNFYRDVLGFPLKHCILAPGWGNDPHPDFAHFFFDVGANATIAFFYYFGVEPYVDINVPDRINKSRHLALAVDTEDELDHYQHRIESAFLFESLGGSDAALRVRAPQLRMILLDDAQNILKKQRRQLIRCGGGCLRRVGFAPALGRERIERGVSGEHGGSFLPVQQAFGIQRAQQRGGNGLRQVFRLA